MQTEHSLVCHSLTHADSGCGSLTLKHPAMAGLMDSGNGSALPLDESVPVCTIYARRALLQRHSHLDNRGISSANIMCING